MYSVHMFLSGSKQCKCIQNEWEARVLKPETWPWESCGLVILLDWMWLICRSFSVVHLHIIFFVLHSSSLFHNAYQWQVATHALLLLWFQCEENTSLADCSRYLKLPFSKANLPSNNQTLKGTKESFWITSFLCSTKLTQNGKADSGVGILATRLLSSFFFFGCYTCCGFFNWSLLVPRSVSRACVLFAV